MTKVRLYGVLIALALLADFIFQSWSTLGPATSLMPALVGATAMLLVAWRDAASQRRRRVVAAGMILLTGCVATSLALNVVGREAVQALLLAALLAGSAAVSIRAVTESRKRRERLGLYRYYVV